MCAMRPPSNAGFRPGGVSQCVAASVVPSGRVVSCLGGGTVRCGSRVVRGGSGIRAWEERFPVWEALTQRWEEYLSIGELVPTEVGAALSGSWEAALREEIGRMQFF